MVDILFTCGVCEKSGNVLEFVMSIKFGLGQCDECIKASPPVWLAKTKTCNTCRTEVSRMDFVLYGVGRKCGPCVDHGKVERLLRDIQKGWKLPKVGYQPPSVMKAKAEAFVRTQESEHGPRMCTRCGYVGPRIEWPAPSHKAEMRGKSGQHLSLVCRGCQSAMDLRKRGDAAAVKTCQICREPKPLAAFGKLHCSIDGHRTECAECRAKIRARNPFLVRGENLRIILNKVERKLAREWAALNRPPKKTPEQNVERLRAKAREYYKSNPDKERERVTRYKHANPEKVAKWGDKRTRLAAEQSDGILNAAVVGRLFAAARKCPYCSCKLEGSAKSLDHLDPLNDGGTHGISNVAICCRSCNIKKHARPFAEWLAKIPEANRPAAQRLYRRVRGFEPAQQSLALSYAASVYPCC